MTSPLLTRFGSYKLILWSFYIKVRIAEYRSINLPHSNHIQKDSIHVFTDYFVFLLYLVRSHCQLSCSWLDEIICGSFICFLSLTSKNILPFYSNVTPLVFASRQRLVKLFFLVPVASLQMQSPLECVKRKIPVAVAACTVHGVPTAKFGLKAPSTRVRLRS